MSLQKFTLTNKELVDLHVAMKVASKTKNPFKFMLASNLKKTEPLAIEIDEDLQAYFKGRVKLDDEGNAVLLQSVKDDLPDGTDTSKIQFKYSAFDYEEGTYKDIEDYIKEVNEKEVEIELLTTKLNREIFVESMGESKPLEELLDSYYEIPADALVSLIDKILVP